MKYLLTVMTCDRRQDSLTATLDSLKASDWNEEPLIVHDTLRYPDPKESQTATALKGLREAMERPWEYLLFCEDDVAFNRNLRHNLDAWTPIRLGMLLVGSLYQHEAVPPVADYGLVPCRLIGGSQAIVLARQWVPVVIENWHRLAGEGMQDLRMYRSLCGVFPWVFVHSPNLVQHRPVNSTWGGPGHSSPTFSEDWRA